MQDAIQNEVNISPYSDSSFDTWEAIANSENARGIFQFSRLFLSYHGERFLDESCVILKKDTPIGIFPAVRMNGLVHSHPGMSFGGVLFAKPQDVQTVLDTQWALFEYYKEKGFESLRCKEIPSIYGTNAYGVQQWISYLFGGAIVQADLNFVEAPGDEDCLSQLRKRSLKKAITAGVAIDTAPSFEEFWKEVLIPNLEHRFDAAPVHNLDEITLLQSRFPGRVCLYCARQMGKILAGVVTFESENVTHMQYISSNEEGKNLSALDLIVDFLRKKSKDDGKILSFGTSNENCGKRLNLGLARWKESFGTTPISHIQSVFSLNQNFIEIRNRFYTKRPRPGDTL